MFILLIVLVDCLHRHDSWSENEKKRISITDVKWNYCDVKCLYLERYHPDLDFVVLIFQPLNDPSTTVGACYVKQIIGIYSLWNTVIYN